MGESEILRSEIFNLLNSIRSRETRLKRKLKKLQEKCSHDILFSSIYDGEIESVCPYCGLHNKIFHTKEVNIDTMLFFTNEEFETLFFEKRAQLLLEKKIFQLIKSHT